MERKTHSDLWKQAEILLREEISDKEWTMFTTLSSPATPQAVSKEMEQSQDRMKNEYTTHSFTLKDRKIFEFNVGRILKRFEILCKMFDSSMSYAPETVGIVWTAFRMLTKFFLDDQELCELLTSAIDRMSDVIFVCDVYANRYLAKRDLAKGDDTANVVLEKIPHIYKTVLRFSFETKKLFPNNDKKTRNKIGRVLAGMFGSTGELRALVDDAKSQMQQLYDIANVKFQTVVEEVVAEINQKLEDLSRGIKSITDLGQLWHAEVMSELRLVSGELGKTKADMEKKRVNEEFERWLSWLRSGTTLDMLQPREQQRENMNKKSENTCGWIFDRSEYQAWLTKTKPQILFLNGPAGCGKSVLTSSVINSFESRRASGDSEAPILIYFFCQIGNDTKQKGEKIMLHLLMQLFSKLSTDTNIGLPWLSERYTTTARCIEMLRACSKTKNHSEKSDVLSMAALGGLLIDLAAELERDVVIIIDALDECIDRKDSGFIETLIDTVSTCQNIRLFFSARPENDIVQVFGPTSSVLHLSIEVEKASSEADIIKYVDEKLSHEAFASVPKSDKKRARKAILKKSEGMFQYAAIAVQGLSSAGATANFSRALKDLPKGMNSLYSRKLRTLDESNRQYLRTILRWMVCAEGLIKAAPIVDEFGTISQRPGDDIINEDASASDADFCDDSDRSDDFDDSDDSDESQPHLDLDKSAVNKASKECPLDEELDKLRVTATMEKLMLHVREFVKFDPISTVISLQHASIQDWITQEAKISRPTTSCMECRKRELDTSGSIFELAPKYGHFLIACTIMRRMNDPLFQARFLNMPNIEDELEDLPKDLEKRKFIESPKRSMDSQAVPNSDQVISGMNQANGDGQGSIMTAQSKASNGTNQPNDHESKLDHKPVDNELKMPGENLISHEELYLDNATDDARSTYGDKTADSDVQQESNKRYELTHWVYHVRRAEQLWPEEERNQYPDKAKWDQLYNDIERFMDPKSKVYKTWLKLVYNVPDVTMYWEAPVRIATKIGLEGTLKRYIADGADLWEVNEWRNNCLHHVCVGDGDFVGLELVLEEAKKTNPAAINQPGGAFFGETPIMIAASYRGTSEHIKALLAYGAKPSIPDQFGNTCLHYAVKRRDAEMCRVLLDCKEVDVNATDEKGETPLHWLLKERNAPIEIARLLIEHGADVRREDNDSQAPLYEAASTGNVEIARLLLDHGADVNDGENVFGWTAVHAAVNDMNVDIVKVLIEYDAEILTPDHTGRNPIAQAANIGEETIFKILLESQMKKSGDSSFLLKQDIKGHTALHRIAAKNRLEMAKLLLSVGDARVLCSQQNVHGAIPLHSAARRGCDKIVALLLEKGSDFAAVDRAGNTPLDLAVRGWKYAELSLNSAFGSTAAMLIDAIADVSEMASILDFAIEKGAEEVCRRLTMHTNLLDEHGWTPLLLAVQERQESITRLLSPFDTVGVLAKLSSKREAEMGLPPTAWGMKGLAEDLIISEDGLSIHREKIGLEYGNRLECAISNHPIPAGRSHYYYEVEFGPDPENPLPGQVKSNISFSSLGNILTIAASIMCMGFCSSHAALRDQLPGWAGIKSPSWGYHGDDGCIFRSRGPYRKYPEECRYGPTYNIGDIVGAGVDFRSGLIFYTKNGIRLGDAETGDDIKGRLYPLIGFSPCGVRVRANFGTDPTKPFMYKWNY